MPTIELPAISLTDGHSWTPLLACHRRAVRSGGLLATRTRFLTRMRWVLRN